LCDGGPWWVCPRDARLREVDVPTIDGGAPEKWISGEAPEKCISGEALEKRIGGEETHKRGRCDGIPQEAIREEGQGRGFPR